ncbi:MAG: class I SAM-dependent methyltransferase [Methylocella sp.]
MALTGFVDVCKPTVIGGWAWDSEHPEAFVDVEILREGTPLARITANAYRAELSESELGDGKHAYWFTPDAPLEELDKIEVKIVGTDVRLSRIQKWVPIPTDDLIHFVVGPGNNIPQFLATGAADLKSIETLLAEARFELKSGSRILDWGCGCGRVARHWEGHAGDIDLYGCDINDRLVIWCKENIPFGSFTRSELIPPLPYPDNYFDLLYGISVLTHLLFDTQYLWMAEIWRLLKPGGIAILTAHGPSMFPIIAKQIAGSTGKIGSTLVDAGMFISLESGEGSNQTWNMVTADVMSKIFYPFKILNYRPCYGLMGIQDTYVFAKKSSGAVQFMPSFLECEMQGSVFERRMEVRKTSQRQCAVLASAKNLLLPATIQLGLHFPNSDMPSVASRVVSLPEKVPWTDLQAAYTLVTIEEIPEWDGPAMLSVEVKGSAPLNGVVLQLRNCIFL